MDRNRVALLEGFQSSNASCFLRTFNSVSRIRPPRDCMGRSSSARVIEQMDGVVHTKVGREFAEVHHITVLQGGTDEIPLPNPSPQIHWPK